MSRMAWLRAREEPGGVMPAGLLAAASSAASRCSRTGSGATSATPGSTAAALRAT